MSRLYWMSNIIATNESNLHTFTPTANSGLTKTNVQDAINECAEKVTGIKQSVNLSVGTTSFTVTNIQFRNNSMYFDYYCTKTIRITEVIPNPLTTTSLTFKCEALTEACTFVVVGRT